ncbi:MAG TPA: hypothetical protein VHE13_17905 [Opitutus sp.]|nr:hypothetical protein [Opitutus sp.]
MPPSAQDRPAPRLLLTLPRSPIAPHHCHTLYDIRHCHIMYDNPGGAAHGITCAAFRTSPTNSAR